ncbi:AAWKG family protein [Streptomyces bacillaris]
MADQYDKDSVSNVNEYRNKDAASSDNWAELVHHITGYPVPDRAKVFDSLRSDHGGKLFRMDIKERSLGLLVKDSGFLQSTGQDYDIWFFDAGKRRSVMQARIVFEGRVKSGDEIIFAGTDSTDVKNVSVREGNEFTDYNKDKMSTIPLARYMNGPRAALLALLDGNSGDGRFSGLVAKEADVVDLKSFTETGHSFDYAAKFFKDHAPLLKEWEERFSREDASWKGDAAEVFLSLIKKIRENYDSYVETFNDTAGSGDQTGTGSTVYSRALSLGRSHLEQAARDLLGHWLEWARSPYYDPLRVLRYVLDDLATWVDTHNIPNTKIQSTTTRYSTSVSHTPQTGFTQAHPEYGDLTDIANWAKVGDKAADIWSRAADDMLGTPAREVQSRLNNQFLTLSKDFSENVPKPKSTGTASEEYEKKKAEEEKEEIRKQNEQNKKDQDELREEQRKQREEDKKYQEELREEQRKQREEDKKDQDELREEQRKQREEDKKLQDELREEQRKQREEDKKYQDELREEQRREQEEAKREAEEQTRQMEESLGSINGPGGGGRDGIGDLDDLLNLKTDLPVTESLGSLTGINPPPADLGGANPPSLDDVNKAVTQNLGNLGDVNNPGGGPLPVGGNLGNLGGLNGGPGNVRNPNEAANNAVTEELGSLGSLNSGPKGSLDTPTGGVTQLDGNQLTTGFPDGSSTSFDRDSGVLTTTHPDGSTTTQDLGDGTRVTNPDGSVTSLGDDGKLTTTFPDGTTQVVDPRTGQSTSTAPDGTVTTKDLGSLGGLNNRNDLGDLRDLGNLNPDLPTESPGSRETVEDLGNLGNLNSDTPGLKSPTGSLTGLEGGDFATLFPEGGKSVFDPDTGQLTSIAPDGSKVTTDLTHGAEVTNPDGSVSSLDNGRFVNSFPDGSSHSIDPDTGITTVTDPQGRTQTVDLGELNSRGGNNSVTDLLDELRDLGNQNRDTGSPGDLGGDRDRTENRDLGNLGNLNGNRDLGDLNRDLGNLGNLNGNRDLGDLGDLNRDLDGLGKQRELGLDALGNLGGGGGGGGEGTTRNVPIGELGLGSQLGGGGGGQGAELPPQAQTPGQGSSFADGTSNNAANPGGGPGAPGAPGMPGTPGMPMGGMGGGGGDKGNGERVRAVLVDAAEESERRNRRRRSPWNRQEDSDTFLSPASRVATTGGESVEEEREQSRRPATSADYLEEDADVWGTEEGGTPAVIGR